MNIPLALIILALLGLVILIIFGQRGDNLVGQLFEASEEILTKHGTIVFGLTGAAVIFLSVSYKTSKTEVIVQEGPKNVFAPVTAEAKSFVRRRSDGEMLPVIFANDGESEGLTNAQVEELRSKAGKLNTDNNRSNPLFMSQKKLQQMGDSYTLNLKFKWSDGIRLPVSTGRYRMHGDVLILAQAAALDMSVSAKYVPYEVFRKDFSISLNLKHFPEPEHIILYVCEPDSSQIADRCSESGIYTVGYFVLSAGTIYALNRPLGYLEDDFLLEVLKHNGFFNLAERRSALQKVAFELSKVAKVLYPPPLVLGPGRTEVPLNSKLLN